MITGAGGTFSAGADLKAAARGERGVTQKRGGFGFFAKPPRKPVIAAVEGYAVGGGFELCLSCDLIVAAKTAKFGLPEVRHNVVALGGGLFRLPKRIPYHVAMELALTGEFKDADYFHRLGIVNRIAEDRQGAGRRRRVGRGLAGQWTNGVGGVQGDHLSLFRLERRRSLARADDLRGPCAQLTRTASRD